MTIRSTAVFMAALLCGIAGAADAQTRPQSPQPTPPDSMAQVARLYDSLSARPGWPTAASEAEVDAGLARRGLNPEQRRSIVALMRQDVCRQPEMVPVCRYYGAETIYKVQRLGWGRREGPRTPGRPGEQQSPDILIQQMRLLEYGATRNLARLYADGLSDAREAELNNTARAAARAAASSSTQLTLWFACGTDEQTLPFLNAGFPSRYRLTTCGTGFGLIWRIVIWKWEWSYETDLLVTHSRFARNVGLWWLTGAEQSICANSTIDGYGNQACNNYRWYSPVSFNWNPGTFNSPPVSVISTGSAARLNYPFGVTIVHQ